MNHSHFDTFNLTGFCWLRIAIPADLLAVLLQDAIYRAAQFRKLEGGRTSAGLRMLPSAFERAQDILRIPVVEQALSSIIGPHAPARVILFDKTEHSNWSLTWHRDTQIPVKEHRPSTMLTAPTAKEGVKYVNGSLDVLSRMVAIRIHLDPVNSENGPLVMLPGSHQIQSLDESSNVSEEQARKAVECHAQPGDILLMHPLLLHRSLKPTKPTHRRVLHIEMRGMAPLPDGFEWAE